MKLFLIDVEIEAESQKLILDLSKKCLKKIPKTDDAQQYKVLILDDNELQKIDNIDSYLKIEKVDLNYLNLFHYSVYLRPFFLTLPTVIAM